MNENEIVKTIDLARESLFGKCRNRKAEKAARKSRMRDVQRRAFLGQSAPSTHP